MARLEKVVVNGEDIPLGSGLEGRIASRIDRNGVGSCVVLQVGVDQKSYSFVFPRGCAGSSGGGGSGGPASAELSRLERVYLAALEELERQTALLRKVVAEFIKSL